MFYAIFALTCRVGRWAFQDALHSCLLRKIRMVPGDRNVSAVVGYIADLEEWSRSAKALGRTTGPYESGGPANSRARI